MANNTINAVAATNASRVFFKRVEVALFYRRFFVVQSLTLTNI